MWALNFSLQIVLLVLVRLTPIYQKKIYWGRLAVT